MSTRKLRALPLFLAALMLCLTAFPASAAESAGSAAAATMQLMKTDGTVNVTNSSGRSLTKRDNMRLYNGYHVKTGAASYAWIDLDSAKLTKLDAVSDVEVRKSGKKLELLLSSGNLYFNVTSPLEEGETLNVRTATMVVGIRGTCGWLKVNDRWNTEISVLEGTVQCNVTDPVTGQVKTASVQGGEKAIATVYPQGQGGDKCDIIQERLEPGDINGFVLEELAQDPELCAGIYEASGLDILDALETARERLKQDQQEMQEMLDRIVDQQAEQDSNVSTGPVWEQNGPASNTPDSSTTTDDNSSDSSGSSGGSGGSSSGSSGGGSSNSSNSSSGSSGGDNGSSGGGGSGSSGTSGSTSGSSSGDSGSSSGDSSGSGGDSSGSGGDSSGSGGSGDNNGSGGNSGVPDDPTKSGTITLTMEEATAQAVQDHLNDTAVSEVILQPKPDPASLSDNILNINIKMTVPDGKKLTLSDRIDVAIQDGSSLTVIGTMTGEGANTLTNDGTLTVENLTIGDLTTDSSDMLKMNSIEGISVIFNNETGRIVTKELKTTGELSSDGIIEGTVIHAGGDIAIIGGTIKNPVAGAALVAQGGGTISIYDGTIDGGGLPAILVDSSFVMISIGDPDDKSNNATIKSTDPDSVIQINEGGIQYAMADGGGNWSYKIITKDSILITTPSDGDSYRLVGVADDE